MQDAIDALTYMAEYCLNKKRLEDAELYAMRLQDFGGPAKDQGRQIMNSVKLLHAAAEAAGQAAPPSTPHGLSATFEHTPQTAPR